MVTILIVAAICISAFFAFIVYCACVLASGADDAKLTWKVGKEEGSSE